MINKKSSKQLLTISIISMIVLVTIFSLGFASTSVDWTGTFGYWNMSSLLSQEGGNLIDSEGSPTFQSTNCKLGGCANISVNNNFYLTQEDSNFSQVDKSTTINMWLYPTTIDGAVDPVPLGRSSSDINVEVVAENDYKIYTFGGATLSGTTMPLGSWTMLTITKNSSHMCSYANSVLESCVVTASTSSSGNLGIGNNYNSLGHDWTGLIDDMVFFNRPLNTTEISNLYNGGSGEPYSPSNITLVSPTNDSTKIKDVEFKIFTSYPGTTLVNITLYIDGIRNETKLISGSSNETYFNKTLTRGKHNWTAKACNDASSCLSHSNFTLTIGDLQVNSETYSSTSRETSEETFKINITYISSLWNSITAKLNYASINYTGTQSGTGDTIEFSANVSIGAITGSEQINPFHWIFSLTNSTSTEVIESTKHNQTVSAITFKICNSTDTPFIRFITKNATNPFPSINATFKSAWNIRDATGSSVLINRSHEDTSELNSSWEFCLVPSDKDYTISVDIEVDAANSAKNFHFITNATYSNQTTNVTLYLLDDSKATLTVLKVVDDSRQPVEGVYISTQFYDVGTDTFYNVGMSKTSFSGEDLVYLNWYDSLYKFVLVKDGTTQLSTSPYKISSTPQTFEITTDTLFEFDKFDDFEYSLYFNNVTGNFVLTFVKPSGEVEAGCLRVIKRNRTADYEICNICETSNSATLYCNINDWGNGTFFATFYATGSLKFITVLEYFKGVRSEVYDLLGDIDGTALAIILAGVVMAFFLISPTLGIIGILLGVGASVALGFQVIDTTTFLSIALIGGIIIWIIQK